MDGTTIIGVGLYSVPEAGRLAGVPSARIRRWLLGYDFKRAGDRRRSSPVWKAQLPPLDGTLALGFLDLMEVRFVDAFLKAGLPLSRIRKAARLASELVGADHPFSTRKFRTDGKTIFAELQHPKGGDKTMLDLERRQFGIYEFIVPSLMKGVEFDDVGQAARWYPDQAIAPAIVIDPERQFGQPIVERSGTQTSAIVDAFRAEGSVDSVARWFEIPPDEVKQALEFEFRLAA
jgi:uncharacterized protein (DUF433 family)